MVEHDHSWAGVGAEGGLETLNKALPPSMLPAQPLITPPSGKGREDEPTDCTLGSHRDWRREVGGHVTALGKQGEGPPAGRNQAVQTDSPKQ